MNNSDLLLVFSQTQHEYFIIPSKVFEILGLKKMILCFTSGGATYNLLKKTGGAIMVDQENLFEIKKALKKIYNQWMHGEEVFYNVDTTIFERRSLTKQLADILD